MGVWASQTEDAAPNFTYFFKLKIIYLVPGLGADWDWYEALREMLREVFL